MTIQEGTQWKTEGFGPQRRLSNVKTNEITKGPIYRQSEVCFQVRGELDCRCCNRLHSRIRSILCYAFGRRFVSTLCTFDRGHCIRLHCVRSHKMRLIPDNCLRIPTAQELKQWSIRPARARRETQVHVDALDRDPCARAQCARSHCLGSRLQLSLISPLLNPNLHQRPTAH